MGIQKISRSQRSLRTPDKIRKVTIPNHRGDSIFGLRGILQQAGLALDLLGKERFGEITLSCHFYPSGSKGSTLSLSLIFRAVFRKVILG